MFIVADYAALTLASQQVGHVFVVPIKSLKIFPRSLGFYKLNSGHLISQFSKVILF